MANLARRAMVAGAALAVTGLAGCGGPATTVHGPAVSPDREWIANASGVIDQLSGDVSATEPAEPGLAGAKHSLENLSELYGLLVAYTDLGGCSKMVAGIGRTPPGFALVVTRLQRACVGFERASKLFQRASADHDARALLAAWREVRVSREMLFRATLAFAAARSAAAR